MKYLDILKNYNDAILKESAKLQGIYESLCNEESDETKTMTEFTSEDENNAEGSEGSKETSGNLQNKEDYYNDAEGSKLDTSSNTADNSEEASIDTKKFFEKPANKEANKKTNEPETTDESCCKEAKEENQPSSKNSEETSADNSTATSEEPTNDKGDKSQVVMNAKSLFGEDEVTEDDILKDKPHNNHVSTVSEGAEKSEDVEKTPETSCKPEETPVINSETPETPEKTAEQSEETNESSPKNAAEWLKQNGVDETEANDEKKDDAEENNGDEGEQKFIQESLMDAWIKQTKSLYQTQRLNG